jgi:hypothetical protein
MGYICVNKSELYRLRIAVWDRVPPPQPCESQKATKRAPGAWGYNWATLVLGVINTETLPVRWGFERNADDQGL